MLYSLATSLLFSAYGRKLPLSRVKNREMYPGANRSLQAWFACLHRVFSLRHLLCWGWPAYCHFGTTLHLPVPITWKNNVLLLKQVFVMLLGLVWGFFGFCLFLKRWMLMLRGWVTNPRQWHHAAIWVSPPQSQVCRLRFSCPLLKRKCFILQRM